MSSNTEDISDKENVNNTFQIEEESTYPLDNNIIYWERINKVTKCSFSYVIIKEGIYPDSVVTTKKPDLANSTGSRINNIKRRPAQQFKVPHGYIVETTWGRTTKKRTVRCEIEYIDTIPYFRIKYGSNFQHVISSTQSTSNVALKYEQVNICHNIFGLYAI